MSPTGWEGDWRLLAQRLSMLPVGLKARSREMQTRPRLANMREKTASLVVMADCIQGSILLSCRVTASPIEQRLQNGAELPTFLS